LPNVVLEAAAAALPIVATAVGGTGEIVTDEVDGLLVRPGDPDSMREALERLLDDPALRARLGAAAQRRAADFSPGRLVEATGGLYESLVDQALRRRSRPSRSS
jgi:glycosyltransferase involved in cell wall biosynthesis